MLRLPENKTTQDILQTKIDAFGSSRTDQGTNFTSQVVESLWELLDVHALRTTAYHPQADGITERFNRTIKDMLTQFDPIRRTKERQNDWDIKLEKLSFAYNIVLDRGKVLPWFGDW